MVASLALRALALFAVVIWVAACSSEATLPPAAITTSAASYANASDYRIGPGDQLNVVVWHNTDVSGPVPVRPDGRISIPLIGDVVAAGKTPMDLAAEIKEKLKPYIKDPVVTVTPTQFVGPVGRQVRVIGEAVQPRAIPFSSNMTLLDVMIAVGGLTRYADGDRAVIVRVENGVQKTYHVHLDELIRDGDVNQNVAVRPGDILIIPQRFF
ncbi:MAG TPA: XrtA/PEP-CTERM system exopolysaccharide export protein [Rhizomicrobium sp.]|nr:XrtA/PEP-CTERM system exopolysaccharide export protein [Rhizomicrobium sp.]